MSSSCSSQAPSSLAGLVDVLRRSDVILVVSIVILIRSTAIVAVVAAARTLVALFRAVVTRSGGSELK